MATSMSQEIEEQINRVEHALKDFFVDHYGGQTYGHGSEYTAQSLKVDIKAILTDLRGLVRAPEKFMQLSTHQERHHIRDCLINIAAQLHKGDCSRAVKFLEDLKPVIRSMRVSSETQKVLEERIDRINAEYAASEESINTINRIGEKAKQEAEKIQSAAEKVEFLGNAIAELREKAEQAENLQKRTEQGMEQILTSVKSRERVINNFVQRIEKREQQLDEQQQSTDDYNEKLKSFEEEHKEKFEEAKELIKQAREALRYTTAAGISAAFDERYMEDKKSKTFWWWCGMAVIFMGISIGIGIWLVWENQDIGLGLAISRIAVMSATLYGAWFCAAQCVKRENILEDYSYKAVLSKSMIAFLDQFTGEERERYLEMVLTEIHKDPLRKRHDDYGGPGQGIRDSLRKRKKKDTEAESISDDPSNQS